MSDQITLLQGRVFKLGQVVMTKGIGDELATSDVFGSFVYDSMQRHMNSDWGELCKEDKQSNELALKQNGRLFSTYEKEGLSKIWIITECDRSVTTILLPEEY